MRDGHFHGQCLESVIGNAQLVRVARGEDRKAGIDLDYIAQRIELPALDDGLDARGSLRERQLVADRIIDAGRRRRVGLVQARLTRRVAAMMGSRLIGSGGSCFILSSAFANSSRTSPPIVAAIERRSAPFLLSQKVLTIT